MATIIDALAVTFGLDASDYNKKRKEIDASLKKFGEASAKQTKLIAEHTKKAAGAFSLLKVQVLGALAAFGMGAGFKAFIQDNMNAQAATGRWSSLLKVSAHDMQAWGGIAKGMGGSAQEAVQTMQSLASGFTEAQNTGTSALMQASRRWGFTISKDPLKTLDSLHDRMLKAVQAGNPEQAEMIGQSAGVNSQALLFYLMQNQKKYLEMRQQMLAATGGMDPQSTAKAAELQWQLALLEARLATIVTKIFNKVGPILIKLGNQLANWLKSVDWDKVIDQIGKFLGELNKVINTLGGVKGILIEIAAIKVFGWVVSIAGWVIQLKSLTGALVAARAAAAAGAAGAAAGGTGAAAAGAGEAAAAGGSAGLLARAIPWALPIWALFHSESTGGKRRADGTYEDEVDWNSPEQQAGIARQKAAQDKSVAQTFSSLESKYGLPSGLLDSVYNAESSRGKHLVSPKGALGPFQFMPATAAQYGLKGSDVNDTGKAADAAARYLHNLIAQFHGNVPEAVAAYNWGPGNVQRKGMGALPQETSDYISKVLGGMSAYVGARPELAKSGESTSTNTVTISNMTINTKATNANDIFRDARKAVQANPLIAGSVTAAA